LRRKRRGEGEGGEENMPLEIIICIGKYCTNRKSRKIQRKELFAFQ
jgi:hypothetical protein